MLMKVLFVAGAGRSGSTILASLLGQFKSFVSVGEVAVLWRRGLLENRHCSCKLRFRDCPFWRTTMEAYLSMPPHEIEYMSSLTRRLFTISVIRRFCRGDWPALKRDAGEYAEIVGDIYRKIQESTECSVIVDSSKHPSIGHAIGLIPDVHLFVLHLIRDARAVAHSWQRQKAHTPFEGGLDLLPRFQVKRSASEWLASNALTEFFWDRARGRVRYMVLRYEDFVREPKRSVQRICDLLGEKEEPFFLPG